MNALQAGRICERCVELSYSGQLDKHLMHGMKNSAASDTPVMNVGLSYGQVKDSNYAAPPAHDHKHGKALDIVGNAGEGEIEGSRSDAEAAGRQAHR